MLEKEVHQYGVIGRKVPESKIPYFKRPVWCFYQSHTEPHTEKAAFCLTKHHDRWKHATILPAFIPDLSECHFHLTVSHCTSHSSFPLQWRQPGSNIQQHHTALIMVYERRRCFYGSVWPVQSVRCRTPLTRKALFQMSPYITQIFVTTHVSRLFGVLEFSSSTLLVVSIHNEPVENGLTVMESEDFCKLFPTNLNWSVKL